MIEIDGSIEEGGGAILRLALSLSTATGKPFRIKNIRVNRTKPGLKQQHIVGIRALQELSNAKVSDAFPGSLEITFIPGKISKKKLFINAQTAAPITLIMQSLLPAIIINNKQIILEIEGGTDVSWSPQIDYFTNVFLDIISDIVNVNVKLLRRGYYPKGSGLVEFNINPKETSEEILFTERGKLLKICGNSHASTDLEKLRVAERMSEAARQYIEHHYLDSHGDYSLEINSGYRKTESTGAGITLWAKFSNTVLGVDMLGERGKSAEIIGEEIAKNLVNLLDNKIIIDSLLADQLIIYLALFGGKLETSEITAHTKANIHVCEQFLDVNFLIVNNRIICKKNNY